LLRSLTLTVSLHEVTTAPAGMLEMSKAIRVRWTLSEASVTPTTRSGCVP